MRQVAVTTIASCLVLFAVAAAGQPSFDCDEAEGSVEELICGDSELATLDRDLDAVWRQVLDLSADNVDLATIKTEQRGWIKGRNECWKADDVRACVVTEYRRRTAELQARWRLVPATGPYFFVDPDQPADEIVVTYFATDPPVAVLERGDRTVVAFRQPSASGAKYAGPNEEFWTQGDEARVTWGWQAAPRRYVRRDPGAGGGDR